jgi:hypothetical protein
MGLGRVMRLVDRNTTCDQVGDDVIRSSSDMYILLSKVQQGESR